MQPTEKEEIYIWDITEKGAVGGGGGRDILLICIIMDIVPQIMVLLYIVLFCEKVLHAVKDQVRRTGSEPPPLCTPICMYLHEWLFTFQIYIRVRYNR